MHAPVPAEPLRHDVGARGIQVDSFEDLKFRLYACGRPVAFLEADLPPLATYCERS